MRRRADEVLAQAWRAAESTRTTARRRAARIHAAADQLEALTLEAASLLQQAREYSDALQRRSLEAAMEIANAVVAPADPLSQLVVSPPLCEDRPSGSPRLVPVLSPLRELLLRACTFAAAASAAWFWLWWVSSGAGHWTALTVVGTAVIAWLFLLPFYFLFFACRMTRVDPAVPAPLLRVAMVVTKTPAEPWAVVRRTLEAMLAQDSSGHDVWLADEDPAPSTVLWCLAHGVRIASRRDHAEYQQVEWPKRRRSKEGNLAFFYDFVGYDAYDVVVQMDADHVPGDGYLQAMLRPFADPAVGYVAAPSICDANRDEGWTVRGRLYKEATLHGPAQAGANGGWAPVCIGSHYAVRTAALREVGGLGPELAEDYSTTLWLQAGGWDGVFSIDADARGDGPESFDEMMLQEVQWARSLGTIATRWARGRLGRVRWRSRLRLGFSLACYPLQGLAMVVATVLPVVGIVMKRSWGNTSFLPFYVHLWPFTLSTLAALVALRMARILRPTDASIWSWEVALFQLVRWPWNLWAFVQGANAGIRRTTRPFRVTPKATSELKGLSLSYLAPVLALVLVSASSVLFGALTAAPLGPVMIAVFLTCIYLLAAVAVVLLHVLQNARRRRRLPTPQTGKRPRLLSRQTGGTAVLAAFATAAVAIGLLATSALIAK